MYVIIDIYYLGYCLGCLNIISSDHPYSDASRLTSRDLYKRKRGKKKQKIEEHSVQSSQVKSGRDKSSQEETSQVSKRQVKSARDKSSQEETSGIDSNIREEKRIEEYTGTTNLKVQCNTSQVYDQ